MHTSSERSAWQVGVALAIGIAATASACGPAAKQPQGSSSAPGSLGANFIVSVSRPDGGNVRSDDGRIDCGGQGTACAPVQFEWKRKVTLTATPLPGYRFEGWAADCSGTVNTCVLDTSVAKADKTAAAVFVPEAWYRGTYFLVYVGRPVAGTISSGDGRVDCGTIAKGPHACGPALVRWAEAITVTVTPDTGRAFLAWTGDCAGQGPSCTLRITPQAQTDKRIAALFDSTIGDAGGVVESPETGVTLVFPPYVMTEPTEFKVTIPTAEAPPPEPAPALPAGVQPVTPVYRIEPENLVFTAPVKVTLPLPPGLAKKPACWWSSHGNDRKFEPIGGVVNGNSIECETIHTSFVFVAEAPDTRTIRGSKLTTYARTGGLVVNEADDLTLVPVNALVPRAGGGYDVKTGAGLADGSYSIPDVPPGSVYVRVGSRYVKTAENVVDFGTMVQGRQDKVAVNLNDPMMVDLNLSGLEPWDPATHEMNVFAPDAGSFFYGLFLNDLQPGATTLTGTRNLSYTRTRMVPVYAINGGAVDGDQIYFMQMVPRTSPTGWSYRIASRAFRGSTTVNPLTVGQLTGTMNPVGGVLNNDVSLDWNYAAFRDAVLQDTPGAAVESGRFENRFRVLGQPGRLDLGITPRQDKRLFMEIPVAPGSTTVSTGSIPVGLASADFWHYMWAASADARIVVTPPDAGTTWSSASIQQWDVLDMVTGRTSVSLSQPLLTPVRDVRVNGQEIMLAPKQGIAQPVTLSWVAPRVGPADVYTVIITHQIRFATGAADQVAVIDTTDTSLEIPPGLLVSGEAYTFQIRASRRGVDPQRPLRQYLPFIRSSQPTQWFTVQ